MWVSIGNMLILHFRNIRQWRQRNKNEKKKDEEEQEDNGASPKANTDDMDILDNTECKFNVNSFKIVYVVNSEYYLYKRTALTKAREVGICLGIPSLGVHNAHSLLACSGVMSLEYFF